MWSVDLTRTQVARRSDIIAAVIRIINRDGYAAASLGKIATEAGANKSTVLYHFRSKQAINEAVIGTIFKDGAAYAEPSVSVIALLAIPGLLPAQMKVEQAVCGLLLLGIMVAVNSRRSLFCT